MSNLTDSEDDFDKKYIYAMTLKCSNCGLIFRKEHQYVCPACTSRNVAKPTLAEFEYYYTETEG